MQIAIDIRALGSGRHSGVQEYITQLLGHMIPLDTSVKYKLFFSSVRGRVPDYPWMHARNVRVYPYRIPGRALVYASRLTHRPRLDLMVNGADVFFFPHIIRGSLSRTCKRVTTFHDLSFERFPEFFTFQQRMWHRLMDPSWQARFSDRIIAVSESTRRDITDIYTVDPVKIHTIHSGVEEVHDIDDATLARFRQERAIPERFILFLGTFEPRKNICGLIKAFNKLRDVYSGNVHLILAGGRGWMSGDIGREIRRSPYQSSIMVTGALSPVERSLYYRLASVFVYPSFFEGFGFPPLEAMASGTPVIVSATSSLPEVVGDAGILVDPYRFEDIAYAIRDVFTQQALRERLRTRGRERAGTFTWEKSATATLQLLTSLQ